MSRKSTLPLVEVSGRPFDMGLSIGRKCARRANAYRRKFVACVEHFTGLKWSKAVQKAGRYLPYAEDFYPDYVEEIRGYAKGARLAFDEVFAMCCHELLSPQVDKGCTDIVVSGDVTENGHVLAGHNEDFYTYMLEDIVLLHARPKGKPEFLCTAYAGLFPSCGMNNAGMSLTGNAVEPNDERIGIPKAFPVMKALEARRIGEALEFAMPDDRASSYNNICSDKNGEIYSLEGSATDFASIYAIDGYLVHTNHYTTDKMLKFESSPSALGSSVFRYNRALRLTEEQLGSVTVESLESIFRDHVNKPRSICRHPDPGLHGLDVYETIFSVIYDLTALEAYVLRGRPCAGEYAVFSLTK